MDHLSQFIHPKLQRTENQAPRRTLHQPSNQDFSGVIWVEWHIPSKPSPFVMACIHDAFQRHQCSHDEDGFDGLDLDPKTEPPFTTCQGLGSLGPVPDKSHVWMPLFGLFVVLQSKLRAASIYRDSSPCPALGPVYMFSYMENKLVVAVVLLLLLLLLCVRSPTLPTVFLGPWAPLNPISYLGLFAAAQLLHQPEHINGKVHGPRYQANGLKRRQRHAVPPHL